MRGSGSLNRTYRDQGLRARIETVLAVAAAAALLCTVPHAVAAFKYVKGGMEAPDFTFKTLAGSEVSLSEFKGSPASLLLFWATWSPRSRPALEDAQKLYSEYHERGLKALAINVDRANIGPEDRQLVAAVKEELALTFPVALDRGYEAFSTFGVVATPSLAILDAEGVIVFDAASYSKASGAKVRERIEILLGVREEPHNTTAVAAPAYKPERKALLYFNLGRNLLRQRNREKAMRRLGDAVDADAGYAAPRVLLGHLLLEQRTGASLARAEELFRAAVEIEPDNVAARSGLGEVLLELERTEEAAEELQKAVALDDTYTPAVSNMAMLLARQGKTVEAREGFASALELNPMDPATYYRRGESRERIGNLEGAVSDYRQAVEILMGIP